MSRHIISVRAVSFLALFISLFTMPVLQAATADQSSVQSSKNSHSKEIGKKLIPNKKCNKCHADEDEKTYILGEDEEGPEVFIYVDPDKFDDSVHGKQNCVGCHANITLKKGEHEEELPIAVGCIECHTETMEEQKDDADPKYKRLDVVMDQIDSYMDSVHARPNRTDQSKTNATCHDCHDAHVIGTLESEARAEHRLKNPEVCGRCHEDQLTDYRISDHGRAVMEDGNAESAVCSDCHTTHTIASPDSDDAKRAITKNCGDCHEDAQRTYFASYHGQVHRLGYTNTAKCYDCHGGHTVKGVDDPTSEIHADNRLENCMGCHEDANENFLTFWPHSDADDLENYPGLWGAKRFMQLLIFAVMAFFWVHVVLWLYREVMDRLQGKGFIENLDKPDVVYYRRFPVVWRWIHGLFAIATMTLILTGTTLLFSHTGWAKAVVIFLGGPALEGIIHRTAAVIWLGIFLTHLTIAISNIWRKRDTFRWFGETSMLPNWKDWDDLKSMFKWFLGRAPRPQFSHWTYWQKFDYWAPFWGAGVIGISGIMLFAPEKTALILPGWMFNIATLIHAEEALLAAIFLNSVHFFNVHFRPERFPMSTTIFTGVIPIEEFKHDHHVEYERLIENGTLDNYLVKRPSRRAELAASFITTVLIMAGLALLTLVLIGLMTAPS